MALVAVPKLILACSGDCVLGGAIPPTSHADDSRDNSSFLPAADIWVSVQHRSDQSCAAAWNSSHENYLMMLKRTNSGIVINRGRVVVDRNFCTSL